MSEYCVCPPKLTSLRGGGPTLVTYQSSFHHRKAVERCARYFKGEFANDHVPFCSKLVPGDVRYVPYEAYLFHNQKFDLRFEDKPTQVVVAGACCFSPIKETWVLKWCWFHPLFRRKGLLSAAWPQFRNQYAGFEIEEPLSAAMEKFLAETRA